VFEGPILALLHHQVGPVKGSQILIPVSTVFTKQQTEGFLGTSLSCK
jgi:hypothetical protein